MSELKVLSVASEIFPLIKTGGLADVVGALPAALAHEGVEVRTLVPAYPAVIAKLAGAETAHAYADLFGGPARVLAGAAAGLELFAIDAPHLYDRPGNPYLGPDGLGWPDNAQRFAALARVGADIGLGAIDAFQPQVVHAHDWQAALAPAYLHYAEGPRPGTAITIHNIAFQGHFPSSIFAELGLPPYAFTIDGVEYFDGVGYLKAGLRLSDRITTVSPTYAREILTPEFGMALDGLLRTRAAAVQGIVNGIDDTVWNPATDGAIAQTFTAMRIDMRVRNKTALQTRMGLAPGSTGRCSASSRAFRIRRASTYCCRRCPASSPKALSSRCSGRATRRWRRALWRQPLRGRIRSPAFSATMSSWPISSKRGPISSSCRRDFEPCGLTQLCALRYGAPPIVARVGGLADTVIDANEAATAAGVATGVQFYPPSVEALTYALDRALEIGRDPATMRRLRLNGMRADVSWRGPAKRYAALYRDLARPAE